MTWTIDRSASSVQFEVRHLGVATVGGSFGGFTGEVGPWGAAGAVEVASLDTGNDIRDGRLRSEFFDAERFPQITFETDQPVGSSVTGRLAIRGVARPVTFDVAWREEGGSLRLAAAATVSRKAFGLDWAALREAGRLIVSDKVRLRLDLVANAATGVARERGRPDRRSS